jgi:glutaminase
MAHGDATTLFTAMSSSEPIAFGLVLQTYEAQEYHAR